MFSRFRRRFKAGWAFGTEAINLVKQHPKLLVFPALSALAFVGIVAQAFWVGKAAFKILYKQFLEAAVANPEWSNPELPPDQAWSIAMNSIPDGTWYVTFGWLFINYLLLWIVAIFLNTAVCGTLLTFHSTRRMSVRTGLVLAVRRLPQIIGWALFASTIGLILSLVTAILEDYLSWFGTILGSLVQLAWSVSVYFVAPVLAAEGIGPIRAVKRSAGMIKKQWGQMVGSEISIFWRLWPLHLVGLFCLVGVFALPIDLPRIACGLGFLTYVIISSALNSLMSGIVCTNLYRFAATGATPTGGNSSAYQAAFRAKK
jgi:Family of unknown function (DUF6159)